MAFSEPPDTTSLNIAARRPRAGEDVRLDESDATELDQTSSTAFAVASLGLSDSSWPVDQLLPEPYHAAPAREIDDGLGL